MSQPPSTMPVSISAPRIKKKEEIPVVYTRFYFCNFENISRTRYVQGTSSARKQYRSSMCRYRSTSTRYQAGVYTLLRIVIFLMLYPGSWVAFSNYFNTIPAKLPTLLIYTEVYLVYDTAVPTSPDQTGVCEQAPLES